MQPPAAVWLGFTHINRRGALRKCWAYAGDVCFRGDTVAKLQIFEWLISWRKSIFSKTASMFAVRIIQDVIQRDFATMADPPAEFSQSSSRKLIFFNQPAKKSFATVSFRKRTLGGRTSAYPSKSDMPQAVS